MYKHILVAVDLSEESLLLLRKGEAIARACNAKLSMVHVDVNFSDLYTGMIDINVSSIQDEVSSETEIALTHLTKEINYPITECFNGCGNFSQVLEETIISNNIDLLIVGHHQDFWGKLISSTRQVMNNVTVDMLIVPLAG